MHPQATNDADGYALYTPNGPAGQFLGSDFTSFFLAAVSNPQINGMRLQKVHSSPPFFGGHLCLVPLACSGLVQAAERGLAVGLMLAKLS